MKSITFWTGNVLALALLFGTLAFAATPGEIRDQSTMQNTVDWSFKDCGTPTGNEQGD